MPLPLGDALPLAGPLRVLPPVLFLGVLALRLPAPTPDAGFVTLLLMRAIPIAGV